jgi:hypothetical protein
MAYKILASKVRNCTNKPSKNRMKFCTDTKNGAVLTKFPLRELRSKLLATAMPHLAICCMGVTITHPLPPLKRGGLSGEAQLAGIPNVIS